MPNTTNFNWVTPADTDLVKDGASAIRTLGNGIDTSLVDLKGGTTGQILSKASATDLDFTWIANDQGDITAVTAGTGISGGGTSGAVTITNSMATEITAAGDIIVGTGSGTFDNLPIGSTGQILTADTTVSPYKVKWASPESFLGCRVTKTGSQAITTATLTAVTWNLEDYDTNSMHDNVTNNSRITIPSGQGGYYLVQANLVYTDAGTAAEILIYKNGTILKRQMSGTSSTGDFDLEITAVLNLAASDYIEIYTRQATGANRNVNGNTNAQQNSAFQVVKLG